MAKTKISKVAKDLNISVGTVVDFLRSKSIEVEDNINARIDDHAVDLLMGEFSRDKDLKKQSSNLLSSTRKKEPEPAKTAPVEEIKLASESANKPKILGKLEFDANGKPIVKKPAEPKPQPAPKPNPDPAPQPNPAPKPQPKYTPYAVKQGDTLGKIAKKHGTTVAAIKKANGLCSDMIKPGQKLKIPKK